MFSSSFDTLSNFFLYCNSSPPTLESVKWVEAIDRSIENPSVRYMDLNPTKYKIVEDGYKSICDGFWKPHLT